MFCIYICTCSNTFEVTLSRMQRHCQLDMITHLRISPVLMAILATPPLHTSSCSASCKYINTYAHVHTCIIYTNRQTLKWLFMVWIKYTVCILYTSHMYLGWLCNALLIVQQSIGMVSTVRERNHASSNVHISSLPIPHEYTYRIDHHHPVGMVSVL